MTAAVPPPAPREQIVFLENVQRLLNEGLFVASYKFALLRALADLCVLKGDDSGSELELHVHEIATHFIELYWRQVRPFVSPMAMPPTVLKQNTGKQAAVVAVVADAQANHNGSLAELRRTDSGRYDRLVNEVAEVVAQMPLWKLQRVGEEVIDFLYPNVGRGRSIRLRPGVSFCLRRFYGITRNLIEGAWVSHVRRLNLDVLGLTADLGDFLFGAERSVLAACRPLLRHLQHDECFYCRGALQGEGDVDHFVPWSRYPADLGHNLVLAHRRCNGDKSDHVAAEPHLQAWIERAQTREAELSRLCAEARLGGDSHQAMGIARWAYSQAASVNGLVWSHGNILIHLGTDWTRLLIAG